MGILRDIKTRDIKTLNKRPRDMSRHADHGQAIQNGMARMQVVKGQLAQMNAALSAPPGDAVEASAQVLSTGASDRHVQQRPDRPGRTHDLPTRWPPASGLDFSRRAFDAAAPAGNRCHRSGQVERIQSGRARYRLVRAGLRAGTAAGRSSGGAGRLRCVGVACTTGDQHGRLGTGDGATGREGQLWTGSPGSSPVSRKRVLSWWRPVTPSFV